MEHQNIHGSVDCSLVERGQLPVRLNDEDFFFTEGPTNDWHGNIFFCDLKQNWIVRYDSIAHKFETWATETGGSNGACFLQSGKLVSCRGTALDVVRWKDDGTVDQVLASSYDGKPFNGPNDLAISRTGWIYFTDPNFDLRDNQPEGVYALSPSGDLTRIDEGIWRPNGIILTPDEKTLIINGTKQRELIAYDVADDGSVSGRRVFAQVRDPNRNAYPGYPPADWFGCDGMAIDVEGNLYVTCGAGVEVFNSLGKTLGTITIPEKPTNACFGGPDGRTLFVTAQKSLYSVRCTLPGIVFQQAAR